MEQENKDTSYIEQVREMMKHSEEYEYSLLESNTYNVIEKCAQRNKGFTYLPLYSEYNKFSPKVINKMLDKLHEQGFKILEEDNYNQTAKLYRIEWG